MKLLHDTPRIFLSQARRGAVPPTLQHVMLSVSVAPVSLYIATELSGQRDTYMAVQPKQTDFLGSKHFYRYYIIIDHHG